MRISRRVIVINIEHRKEGRVIYLLQKRKADQSALAQTIPSKGRSHRQKLVLAFGFDVN